MTTLGRQFSTLCSLEEQKIPGKIDLGLGTHAVRGYCYIPLGVSSVPFPLNHSGSLVSPSSLLPPLRPPPTAIESQVPFHSFYKHASIGVSVQSRSGCVSSLRSRQERLTHGRTNRVHHLPEHLRHRRRIIGGHPKCGHPVERSDAFGPPCSGSGICPAGLDFGWFRLWVLAVSFFSPSRAGRVELIRSVWCHSLGCQSMMGLTEIQWVFRRMRVCYYLLTGLRVLCGLQACGRPLSVCRGFSTHLPLYSRIRIIHHQYRPPTVRGRALHLTH